MRRVGGWMEGMMRKAMLILRKILVSCVACFTGENFSTFFERVMSHNDMVVYVDVCRKLIDREYKIIVPKRLYCQPLLQTSIQFYTNSNQHSIKETYLSRRILALYK